MGLLGTTIGILLSTISNTVQIQKISKLSGQREDIRNVFRGAIVCETRCADQLSAVPRKINSWDIKPKCTAGVRGMTFEVKHPDYFAGAWFPLFKPEEAKLVCKQNIVMLPNMISGRSSGERRSTCEFGKILKTVDFVTQSIGCEFPQPVRR